MSSSKPSSLLFPKSTDLLLHPFASIVLRNTKMSSVGLARIRFIMRVAAGLEPEFENLKEPPDTWDIPLFKEETEEEKHHQNIHKYINALTKHIDRLENIQKYLSFTKFLANKLSENQISVEEWLNYHYSNYVLTTVSIYDIALCLLNVTARLNIKQSLGFEREIRNKINGKKEYEDVKISLDNIKSEVSKHREPRNSFVHSGKNPSHDDMMIFSITDIYNLGDQFSGKENKVASQRRVEEANRHAVKVLKNELEVEMENMCNLLLTLFSALQPIYEKNLQKPS